MKKLYFKRLILAVSFASILYCFTKAIAYIPTYPDTTRLYLIENAAKESGTLNLISGILLHYRFFDCVIVLTILFIASTGVFFMGKKDSDVR